ncbi:MAG: molybdopterin cofactor-binding domain-containing protein [Lysobacterales bacterium]
MNAVVDPSRRQFLKSSATLAAGLTIALALPIAVRRALAQEGAPAKPPAVDPNAFVHIGSDDSVTVLLKHSEMGQGVWTTLPLVLAEELDCDWSHVRVEHAPAAPAYAHTAFGLQMTGGSTSTWESYAQMRRAGAMARAMLVAAAAQRWQVAPSECRVDKGVISHGEKRLRFGEVAEAAARLPAPSEVTLKDAKAFGLIGKGARRLDTPAKISGRAEFGLDVKRPNQFIATVARAPVFGAKLKSFDAAKAKAVPGVVEVVQVPSGVAVIARHTWAAIQGREALVTDWDLGPGASLSSAQLLQDYRKLAATPGAVAKSAGDAASKLKGGAVVSAEYHVPFLAHAPMEPLNCTVEIGKDGCDIWTGTQFQGVDQMAAAQILGLKPEQVRLHTTFLGGGFGRRANPASDFVAEAVHVAKAAGKTVKVVWTREDDVHGGYYRPMWLSSLRATLGKDGLPTAWHHTLVGQSIIAGTPFAAAMIKDGIDATSVEGAANSPYLDAIADHRVELHSPTSPVTVLWWRSVGHSHTAFVVESFIDELARAAKQDPLAYRRALLAKHPAHLAVLNLAAEKFGWGKPLPKGHAAGLAVHESFGSIVAEVAEVSVKDGRPRVHRVVCAVDCGSVVNPDGVVAQMESGIVYGLSAALHGAITLKDGRVEQSNFHDYPALRLADMPRVEVHLAPSGRAMGGAGEPGTPPIAPAVGNALAALTGQRLRSLPFRLA